MQHSARARGVLLAETGLRRASGRGAGSGGARPADASVGVGASGKGERSGATSMAMRETFRAEVVRVAHLVPPRRVLNAQVKV